MIELSQGAVDTTHKWYSWWRTQWLRYLPEIAMHLSMKHVIDSGITNIAHYYP